MKTATPKQGVGMKYQAQYDDPVDASARTNDRQDADHAHNGATKITEGQSSRVKDIKAVTSQQHINVANERRKAI